MRGSEAPRVRGAAPSRLLLRLVPAMRLAPGVPESDDCRHAIVEVTKISARRIASRVIRRVDARVPAAEGVAVEAANAFVSVRRRNADVAASLQKAGRVGNWEVFVELDEVFAVIEDQSALSGVRRHGVSLGEDKARPHRAEALIVDVQEHRVNVS